MSIESEAKDAATEVMPPPRSNSAVLKWVAMVLCAAILVGGAYFGWNSYAHRPATAAEANEPVIRIDNEDANLVHLKKSTATSMKISTVQARRPKSGLTMRLRGQLMLDPSRLVHVHTRFAGEVISVADVKENDRIRQLRVGDRVKSGELLAVIWSKEIGEKKSDLVDAWSQLFLHETILKNLKKLEGGAIAQRTIDEMQRNYEADLIEVTRLRRTLRSWRIDQNEMDEIEAEARRLHQVAQHPSEKESQVVSNQLEAHWAEIEIRAPRDGLVLEKNFTVGDIVDTNLDLFKIADLSRLGVMANAYEEDLPRIDALEPGQRNWRIELNSLPNHPPLSGRFESIGHLIDPNQHTAVITGWIDNPEGLLRVGQFVETLIELPVEEAVIELPVASILDAGEKSFVFVAKDLAGTEIEKREVKIVRRTSDFVWVSVQKQNPEKGQTENALLRPIEVDDRVVVGGVVEINSVLTDIRQTESAN